MVNPSWFAETRLWHHWTNHRVDSILSHGPHTIHPVQRYNLQNGDCPYSVPQSSVLDPILFIAYSIELLSLTISMLTLLPTTCMSIYGHFAHNGSGRSNGCVHRIQDLVELKSSSFQPIDSFDYVLKTAEKFYLYSLKKNFVAIRLSRSKSK